MKSGYVSLIGRPNAGKSTLLNTIIGAKVAIVSDKPQTTRSRILGVKNYPDAQIVFVDTPGIHRPLHRMNVRMVDAAVDTLREVDVVVLVFDATSKPGHGDEYVSSLLANVRSPVVLVLNKIDAVAKARLLPLIEGAQKWHPFAAIVPVSAQTGDGVDRLERVLIDRLPEGEQLYPEDFLTDQPERTLVAETVRERLLHHTRAELPFSTAVVVDEFDETEPAPAGMPGGRPSLTPGGGPWMTSPSGKSPAWTAIAPAGMPGGGPSFTPGGSPLTASCCAPFPWPAPLVRPGGGPSRAPGGSPSTGSCPLPVPPGPAESPAMYPPSFVVPHATPGRADALARLRRVATRRTSIVHLYREPFAGSG
jgi:GTP-binding protein Era